MTDDTVNSQEVVEISDEEADKLFESGGVVEEPEKQPEPELEKQPEPEPEPEKSEPEPEEEKKVNYGALHEERMKRKELQEKVVKMESRFEQLVQLLQPKQEKQVPTVDEDPVANFDARLQQQEQLQSQIIQQQQAEQVQRQVVTAYQAQAAEYASKQPDFTDAYQHLVKGRIKELEVLGYDTQTAAQVAQQEEFNIAYKSLQDGVNPAERLYQIALQRGYSKKEQSPQAPAKDLKVIEKGQQKSKPASGGAPSGELSLEALAEMDDAEFDAAWEKLAKNA